MKNEKYSFIYQVRDKEIELSYNDYELREAAQQYFKYLLTVESITDALSCISESYLSELEQNYNAAFEENNNGLFWDYVFNNTSFLDNQYVIKIACKNAIQEFKEDLEYA